MKSLLQEWATFVYQIDGDLCPFNRRLIFGGSVGYERTVVFRFGVFYSIDNIVRDL